MSEELYPDNNRVQMEKAKKNLVYVGILSIVMLFAGLTSAYIVSMGDAFWVKMSMPDAFWISTGVIIVSSIVMQLAVSFSKKNNSKGLKIAITLSFLLGLSFVFFQFKGYKQLAASGSHMTGSGVVVSDGLYGEYYSVKQDGIFIDVDGNKFMKGNQEMSRVDLDAYKNFMSQFLKPVTNKPFEVKDDHRHILYYNNKELIVRNNHLETKDSVALENVDNVRLSYLSRNVLDERGQFFARGQIGEDFHIYYKGKELTYADGELMYEGKKLDAYLQIKSKSTPDIASSYLWIITILHLLHIFGALLYMVKLLIGSFAGRYESNNNIGLKNGVVFWHFLGILWLYLLLFLLFIH